MTGHHSDDKDYNLNHFDFTPEEPEHHKPLQIDDSFDNEHHSEDRHEPLVTGEPLVNDDPALGLPETDKIESADNLDNITAPLIPPLGSDFSSSKQQNSRVGTSMATAFAVVAMLIAAGAVWLNFDPSDEAKPAGTDNQPASGYNTIINDEILKLRERMAIVELEKDGLNQKIDQQNQVLLEMQQHNRTTAAQVEALKAELGQVTKKLSHQTTMQASTQAGIKPGAEKAVSKVAPAPLKKVAAKKSTQYELPGPLESLPASEMHGSGGDWVVNIASLYSQDAANKELTRLRKIGLDAEVAESVVKGKPIYRIRVAGFTSRAEAQLQKEQLASKHGIKDAWVHKP